MKPQLTLAALLTVLTMPALAQDAAAPESPAAEAPAEPTAAETVAEAQAQPTPEEAAAAEASGTYRFDPKHAQALFSWQHMGFSTSFGTVNGIEGQVTLDPEDPAQSSVSARFPVSAIRTVASELDSHLIGGDFFDPAEDTVTFKSTTVETTGDNSAKVTGDLTLNGQSRPVVLDVVLNQAGMNPVEQIPAVGFTAKTTILRSEFGLGAFAPAVSDEVQIELNIEAVKG